MPPVLTVRGQQHIARRVVRSRVMDTESSTSFTLLFSVQRRRMTMSRVRVSLFSFPEIIALTSDVSGPRLRFALMNINAAWKVRRVALAHVDVKSSPRTGSPGAAQW